MLKVFPLSLLTCHGHDTNYSSIKIFVLVKLIGFYREVYQRNLHKLYRYSLRGLTRAHAPKI